MGDNEGGLSFGCHGASPPALDGPVCLCELYRHSVCFILVCTFVLKGKMPDGTVLYSRRDAFFYLLPVL